ncbi:unnamed protein product [Prorocentrum cordatum]|uniref:Uncharacterized protein n=1 Tax=Prorocentrum cordatum TaxID=2364126 RepID=A0ABN9TDK0_9DINO|nr:unnamed protein product [Polarella glacialis]
MGADWLGNAVGTPPRRSARRGAGPLPVELPVQRAIERAELRSFPRARADARRLIRLASDDKDVPLGAVEHCRARRSLAAIEALEPVERRAAQGNRAVDALARLTAEGDVGFGREPAVPEAADRVAWALHNIGQWHEQTEIWGDTAERPEQREGGVGRGCIPRPCGARPGGDRAWRIEVPTAWPTRVRSGPQKHLCRSACNPKPWRRLGDRAEDGGIRALGMRVGSCSLGAERGCHGAPPGSGRPEARARTFEEKAAHPRGSAGGRRQCATEYCAMLAERDLAPPAELRRSVEAPPRPPTAQRHGQSGGAPAPQQSAGEVSQPAEVSQPDHDALMGEMFARTSELERVAAETVSGIAQDLGGPQLIAKANHLKEVGGISDLRTHVEKVAKDEGMLLMSKVQEAMDVNLDLELLDSPMKLFDSMPPVGIIVAGIAAPMQLRSIKASSESSILTNGILLSVGVGVGFVDWNVPCHDKLVWVWLLVILMISSFLVLCHAWLKAECGAGLDAIEKEQAESKTVKTGNDVWDTFVSLKSGSGSVLKALYTYDKIANSRTWHIP